VGRSEEERLLNDSRGVSSDIGPGREFPGSGVNGDVGLVGLSGAEDPVASVTVSPVAPSRTRKRSQDTVTNH
jgi:hypothetical protein